MDIPLYVKLIFLNVFHHEIENILLTKLDIISPPNIYMHRKCTCVLWFCCPELIPGSKQLCFLPGTMKVVPRKTFDCRVTHGNAIMLGSCMFSYQNMVSTGNFRLVSKKKSRKLDHKNPKNEHFL